MIKHTYQVLGYYRLLDILGSYASCPMGQSDCLSIRPSRDLDLIDIELRLVSELRLLLKTEGFVSYSDLSDILPLLRKSGTMGSFLDPDELLSVLRIVEAGKASKNFLSANQSLCPRVCGLVNGLPNSEALTRNIRNAISENGAIKDSASPVLKKIRGKKIRFRSDLQKKLDNIRKSKSLSSDGEDCLITIRDGRHVIALRTDKKSRLNGIVHDYSKTRVTCYLEPVEVIHENNRVAELIREEKSEEQRILISLTGMVRDEAAELEYLQSLIGRLDGICARARFSEALGCIMPEMGNRCGVELKGARNPILLSLALSERRRNEKQVFPVPVDVLLDEKQNVLIISGPNRGGKTVALKTLGLLSLMCQSGIHIPAEEGSCLPVFDHVFADIGDDQDIQKGLSTFSAHVAHLRDIIKHAGGMNLVIIDEPGMGTDPDEGVALTMAVLDFLSVRGVYVAVSTHLNRLKTYSLLNPRGVNASVEFDEKNNYPTFKLKYGAPGISHALDVAMDMGVPVDILEKAKGYLDEGELRLNRLIEKMNSLMNEAAHEKQEAEDTKRKYLSAAGKIKERMITLDAENRALMESERSKAEVVINEAREELREAIILSKTRTKSAQAIAAKSYNKVRRELMTRFEPKDRKDVPCELKNIEVGQLIYHKKFKQKGVVQLVDHSGGRVQVVIGKVKVFTAIQDLESVEHVQETVPDKGPADVSWGLASWSKEVNVVGFRVDDAIPLIDRTIDRALVNGNSSVRIIHGFGTGTLRWAVRDHLKAVPFVKSIASAEPSSGGDAITVVRLG